VSCMPVDPVCQFVLNSFISYMPVFHSCLCVLLAFVSLIPLCLHSCVSCMNVCHA
jgi:hypothetical protein